ncbi:MAG TPA: DNA polymerase I [Firmicutes bacterium]|nr:DNA polymerase I [Bacillota bacterium]
MKLMAIDGNSLVNRAFYAVRLLTNQDGLYTNAVFGFLNMLLKLIEEEKPEQICVCFDMRAKTFRHLKYEGYKAQRKGMPDELACQMPVIKEVLDKMGIARLEKEGYEADDLLGTLARLCREKGQDCTIVTGDRDNLQFIAQGAVVKLVITKMGQTTYRDYDAQAFAAEYNGLTPDKIVDLKALMGDKSDNIPGVPGIGEKTARGLMEQFGSLQGIYDNLESPQITKGVRKKLEEGKESAQLSYELATGDVQVPLEVDWEELHRRPMDQEGLYQLLSMLEFHSLIQRLGLTGEGAASPQALEVGQEHTPTADWQALLEQCRGGQPVSLVLPHSLAACALEVGDTVYTLREDELGQEYHTFLSALFAGDIPKRMHDAKPVFTELFYRGIQPEGLVCDTALCCYLLNPTENGYGLEKCARSHLGASLLPQKDYEDEQAFGPLGQADQARKALAQHCRALRYLEEEAMPRLEKDGMAELLRQIELPLVTVLARMQRDGFAVDVGRLTEFGDSLTGQIEELRRRIYLLAGEEFNINSTQQLGAVLFDKLGLKATKKTKKGYSTDIEVLEKLRGSHPIVQDVIDYRKLTKLKSTYVDGLTKVVAADGRIHSTFQQMITATGRLSSTDPNLQNIPVRQELGTEIRRCFVPQKGWVLIDADYSQIELRILAHIADDPIMKQAFATGEDIHTVTASQVFGVPVEFVTHEMRSHAKAVNFGIVYGISAFSLSEDIHISPKEAQGYIDSYLEKYAGVRRYMERVKEQAKADGYVTTLWGRRRYLPELKSKNFNMRSFGERVALNTPIQGTAADIIKAAMVHVEDRLQREGRKARLLLQVHDELIIECPPEEVEPVKALLVEEMENAFPLSVKLVADVSEGANWYDAKK